MISIAVHVTSLLMLVTIVVSSSRSFQAVRFVNNGDLKRSITHFDFPPSDLNYEIKIPTNYYNSFKEWHDENLPTHLLYPGLLPDYEHFTPDFSDGLAYPDPFLLVGSKAKRVAAYLYSKELFFNDIPHKRAVLHNQEKRSLNELLPNRLGSIRPGFPFYRHETYFI